MDKLKLTKQTNARNRAYLEALNAVHGKVPIGRSAKESVSTILKASNNGKDLELAAFAAKRERARRLDGLTAIRLFQKNVNRARVNKGFSPLVPKKRVVK